MALVTSEYSSTQNYTDILMFFRSLIFSMLLPLCASQAFAHGECAKISDSEKRLGCFDDAHVSETSVADEKASENEAEIPAGLKTDPVKVAWSTRTKTNPLTDRTDVYLSVRANETVQCGYKTERPTLFLRCMDNTTAVLFVTDCFMSDIQGYGDVRYRVDKNPEKTRFFEESTDNMSLGLWSYRKSRRFIDQLIGGEKLIMQYTPFNDSPKMSTFDISGLEKAIKPLREQCGW